MPNGKVARIRRNHRPGAAGWRSRLSKAILRSTSSPYPPTSGAPRNGSPAALLRAPARGSTFTPLPATGRSCSGVSKFLTIADLPGTAMPMSCSTRLPTLCSAPLARRHRRAFPAFGSTVERRDSPYFCSCGRFAALEGAIIDHVDCTVIAEEPRWAPTGPPCANASPKSSASADSGEHQGDDDRRPGFHRPPRGHCGASCREHPDEPRW